MSLHGSLTSDPMVRVNCLGTELEARFFPRRSLDIDTVASIHHAVAAFVGIRIRWPLGDFFEVPGGIAVPREYLVSGIFKNFRYFYTCYFEKNSPS